MRNYPWWESEDFEDETPLMIAVKELMDIMKKNVDEELQLKLKTYEERDARISNELRIANNEISDLKDKISQLETDKVDSNIGISLMRGVIRKCSKDENTLSQVLELIYPIYKVPVAKGDGYPWLNLLCKYYNNKKEVLDIAKMCGIAVPDKAYKVVVPSEWGEDKLDAWFDNMFWNYVTNGARFKNNLQYWQTRLDYEPQKGEYCQVPWQYIFANPLILTEKYLTKCAEAIAEGHEYIMEALLNYTPDIEDKHWMIIWQNMPYDKLNEKLDKFEGDFKDHIINFMCYIKNYDTQKILSDRCIRCWKSDEVLIPKVLCMHDEFIAQFFTKRINALGTLLTKFDNIPDKSKRHVISKVLEYYRSEDENK